MKPIVSAWVLTVAFFSLVNAAIPSNSTTLSLGQACSPSSSQCAPGVSCYAVNSMEIPTCGSFQGTCNTTSQCATNQCVKGFCAGSVLPFPGAQCTPLFKNATALPCAFGASCYAVNSMEITVCGNFLAECTWDRQCAYNHCQGGFCAGALLSSSSSTSLASSTYSSYAANSTKTTTSIPVTSTGISTSAPSVASPTTSFVYVNATATKSNILVTSTLVVGESTSSAQGSTQTASVQNGGTVRPVKVAAAAACKLGMVGVFMLML